MANSSILRRPAVMLMLALGSVSLVVTLMGKLASGPGALEQKRVQLTGVSGSESYPALSPDSKRVAYSAREGVKVSPFHIFVREVPGGTPKQLTQGEDSDVGPAWSPDGGTLAFERLGEGRLEYIVIAADGGAERKVAEFGPAGETANRIPGVAWTPDGKSLVVTQTAPAGAKPAAAEGQGKGKGPAPPPREAGAAPVAGEKPAPESPAPDRQVPVLAVVTIESGKVQRITNPPEGSEGDSMPAVSPAGDSVAFVRASHNEGADIWLCDLKGENARRVTFDDKSILGITWSRDGQELIYSANRVGGWHLWRVPAAGGSPREITIAGRQAYYPAMGRNRLAYTDSPTVSSIWRGTLTGEDALTDERPVIRSSGRESSPVYSPDGSKIANVSDQTDNDEIFIQDADGKNRVQLTQLKGPRIGLLRWAPDSKQLIFDASSDHGSEVFLIGAVAGALPARALLNSRNASMSQSGKWIYFQSRGQIWKATPSGGNPQALTKMQGEQPVESADGKFVIFRSRRSLWRVPVDGGEEEEFIVPEHDPLWGTTVQPTRKGVYYLEWERGRARRTKAGMQAFGGGQMVVSFYDYATKANTIAVRIRNFEMNGRIDGAFSVSPDGKHVLLAKVDRSQTNLMLVENFK